MTKTGRTTECPNCGNIIGVPDRFHDFPCPKCQHTIHDSGKNTSKGGTQ